VVIVTLANAINDYRKEKQFRKLNKIKNNHSMTVVRDGQQTQLSVLELVVGDIVLLSAGDVVPADGVFISGQSLKVDESAVNGEAEAISKDSHGNEDPFLISGTKVKQIKPNWARRSA
jgi:P-type E1-E2 ATPase